MTRFSRRLLIAIPLIALSLGLLTTYILTRGESLKTRWERVTPGMTRAEVESLLGPPAVSLSNGPAKAGGLMVWVDQLWQVDVTLNSDDKVVRCGHGPSDSFCRRTVGRMIPLPQQ